MPTIWRIPDEERALGETEALHGSVDLMPTLLELAEVSIPETVQGVSQAKVLKGAEPTARDLVYAEYDDTTWSTRVRFLRDEQFAFAYLYGPDHGMLFDMKQDPKQENNIFHHPDYQDVRARFERQLADLSVRMDPWYPKRVVHA